MGLFDNVNQFIDNQLDEFLKKNPHLELQALEEQLREQEEDTKQLMQDFRSKQKQLEEEILKIAEDIKIWHNRVAKAEAAGQGDLAQAAREREAALLRQGNQRWGNMEGVKKSLLKTQELLEQIQQKRKEVEEKAKQVKAKQEKSSVNSSATYGWEKGAYKGRNSSAFDDLEQRFQEWELQEELDQMKRNMQ